MSEDARPADMPADRPTSSPQLRVYRWIGLLLAPAAVTLALLTPAALPDIDPPPTVQPTSAIELPAAALAWINAAPADELARELPGIGPSFAERIATHRRLFGPIADARTLVDLGIPARVVEGLRAPAPVEP